MNRCWQSSTVTGRRAGAIPTLNRPIWCATREMGRFNPGLHQMAWMELQLRSRAPQLFSSHKESQGSCSGQDGNMPGDPSQVTVGRQGFEAPASVMVETQHAAGLSRLTPVNKNTMSSESSATPFAAHLKKARSETTCMQMTHSNPASFAGRLD